MHVIENGGQISAEIDDNRVSNTTLHRCLSLILSFVVFSQTNQIDSSTVTVSCYFNSCKERFAADLNVKFGEESYLNEINSDV